MFRSLLLLLLIISFCPIARAQNTSVYLDDLTWMEVKDRMAQGTNTVIVPSGGSEQNGPYLAIGKHNRVMAYTSGEIARALGNALTAPVLAYAPEGRISPPEGHMRFPGTISLHEETFGAVLEDTARSLKQAGFRTICFVAEHTGSLRMQAYIADKLNNEWRSAGVRVLSVSDYTENNGQEAWARQNEVNAGKITAHAGYADASELLSLDDRMVRKSLIQPYTDRDYTVTGASGDASMATSNAGRVLLDLKIKAAVRQIQGMGGF